MSRLDDLRRVEEAITRISRISLGREAARIRSERAGLSLSRPAINIIATLRHSGPVRLSSLARLADLEAPLISREIRCLVDEGFVHRHADPTDGRAGIVQLTPKGEQAYAAYRHAVDAIVADTLADWTGSELRDLRAVLERLADDFARTPTAHDGAAPAARRGRSSAARDGRPSAARSGRPSAARDGRAAAVT